jgi:hypothetical protein
MSSPDAALLRQLSSISVPYRDPLALVDWGRLSLDDAWLPERALSLYGLPEYAALGDTVKRRLSQYELINVMLCGLWLESLLLLRFARRLDPGIARSEYEYLLHEMREEAGHSLMFLRSIESCGLFLPERAWRAPQLAGLLARSLPLTGAVFWLAAIIAEHVPDQFNRLVRQSAEHVNAAVKQILSVHMVDEARHIALARQRLEARVSASSALRRAALGCAARILLRDLAGVCYFPPASFYELAGLSPGRVWRRRALSNPARHAFVAQCLVPTRRVLRDHGLNVGP